MDRIVSVLDVLREMKGLLQQYIMESKRVPGGVVMGSLFTCPGQSLSLSESGTLLALDVVEFLHLRARLPCEFSDWLYAAVRKHLIRLFG